ncbi:hypothetical protein Tco_0103200 [Tanacetum coccineum]
MAETNDHFAPRKNFVSNDNEGRMVEKCIVEIQGTFLVKIRDDALNGNVGENAFKHIDKFLKVVGPIKINGLTQDRIRLSVFPVSLAGAASEWFIKECIGLLTTWDNMVEKFVMKFHYLSDHDEEEETEEDDNPNKLDNIKAKSFRFGNRIIKDVSFLQEKIRKCGGDVIINPSNFGSTTPPPLADDSSSGGDASNILDILPVLKEGWNLQKRHIRQICGNYLGLTWDLGPWSQTLDFITRPFLLLENSVKLLVPHIRRVIGVPRLVKQCDLQWYCLRPHPSQHGESTPHNDLSAACVFRNLLFCPISFYCRLASM